MPNSRASRPIDRPKAPLEIAMPLPLPSCLEDLSNEDILV
jgi:hypothetical protein